MKTSYYQYTDKHRWAIQYDGNIIYCWIEEYGKMFWWFKDWFQCSDLSVYRLHDVIGYPSNVQYTGIINGHYQSWCELHAEFSNFNFKQVLDEKYQNYLAHKIAEKNREKIIAKMMEDIKL